MKKSFAQYQNDKYMKPGTKKVQGTTRQVPNDKFSGKNPIKGKKPKPKPAPNDKGPVHTKRADHITQMMNGRK